MLRTIFLLSVATLFPIAVTAQDPLATADPALARGDVDAAIQQLESSAAGGDVQALLRLGSIYQRGDVVPADLGKAADYYLRAARLGNADAQFNLANMYLMGEGVSEDRHWAMTYYRLAAEQGHETARHNLNEMLRAGEYDSVAESPPAIAQPSRTEPEIPAAVEAAVSRSNGTVPNAASTTTIDTDQSAALALARQHGINVRFEEPASASGSTAQGTAAATPADRRFDEAQAALADEDFGRAAPLLQALAEAGHAEAQFRLAQLYERGTGVPPDESMAITWYREAARRDHLAALTRLQAIYRAEGLPMPDLKEVPPAQPESNGAGEESTAASSPAIEVVDDTIPIETNASVSAAAPPRDPEGRGSRGFVGRWFGRDQAPEAAAIVAETPVAAEVTDHTVVPEAGESVAIEPPEKRGLFSRWFSRDNAKDTVDANQDAETTAETTGAEDSAEPAALAERPVDLQAAKELLESGHMAEAAAMLTKLADDGQPMAQAHLGYMYYIGEGVPRDLERSVYWYEKAAAQGNRDAQHNLAVAYAFGEGVKRDFEKAVFWYRSAAEQGSAIAQYSLGMSYALGEGVRRDDVAAAEWYRRAAEQGYPAAQNNLAYFYSVGRGVGQSDPEAFRWFKAAAENGHASAQYSVAFLYRSGRGVEPDMEEAIKWYKLAAAQGHPDARTDLAALGAGDPH